MINTTEITINLDNATPQFIRSYSNIKKALVRFTREHSEALDCFPSDRTKRVIPMAMANGFVTENGIQTITPFHNYFYGTGKSDMALCEFTLQKHAEWKKGRFNQTRMFIEIGDTGLGSNRDKAIEDKVMAQLGGRVIEVAKLTDEDFGKGTIFPADGADLFLVRFPESTGCKLAGKVLAEYWDYYTGRHNDLQRAC